MPKNLERNISNLCLALLVIVLALQVFYRYVLQIGLSWSEEVSRFLFIWFAYVSASYAVQMGTHIRVGFIVDLLPKKIARAVKVLSDLLWIGFNLTVVVSGLLLIHSMIKFPVYSTSLVLPLALVYVVIPLAHTLMIIRIVQALWRGGTTWNNADPLRETSQ
jgi:TRAP-type C4-dicarboxylate transport system permease small subunit